MKSGDNRMKLKQEFSEDQKVTPKVTPKIFCCWGLMAWAIEA